jgi:hypothetical protein
MKSRANRRIGTTVTLDGRLGTIVDVGSQEQAPIVKVQWADNNTATWHRPAELAKD